MYGPLTIVVHESGCQRKGVCQGTYAVSQLEEYVMVAAAQASDLRFHDERDSGRF